MAAPPTAVRPATTADTDEVVRLAGLMYLSMGLDISGHVSEQWLQTARAAMHGRLGSDLAVSVADDPGEPGRLAACGAGTINPRLPGPGNPTGRVGYIQWICTEPSHRRRGLSGGIVTALLDWYADNEVVRVELHATESGEPVYRGLGFQDSDYVALVRRLSTRRSG